MKRVLTALAATLPFAANAADAQLTPRMLLAGP